MRRARPLSLFAPVALIAAVGAFAIALPASSAGAGDTVIAEAPPVGPFQRVEISGHANVVLVQGEREAVTVEASPKAGARVRVRSEAGRLSINTHEAEPGRIWLGGGRTPLVTVYFRTLEELRVRGAVKVRSEALKSDRLRIDASGATIIEFEMLETGALHFDASGAVKGEFAGTATAQEVSVSGAGVYRAGKLMSQTATVAVGGAGKAVVNAQRKLHATITGAGAVEYFGDPALTHRISGAGKIIRRSAGGVAPVGVKTA